jgi:oligoendopeptidase F
MPQDQMIAAPGWDLSDFFSSPSDPAIAQDLDRIADTARAFKAQYAGNLASLNGRDLAKAIAAFEAMEDSLGRVISYAQLLHAAHTEDPSIGQFYQSIHERATDIGSDMLFFGLEINQLEDADLAAKMATETLAHYRPWIDNLRLFRPHQLSDDQERLLHEKSVSGRAAWVRLFDETMARLRITIDGQALTEAEVLDRLSSPDAAIRKQAALAFAGALKDNAPLLAHITNTLAKDKETEDKWRGYERPISARNLANQVEDSVVDALVTAVSSRYQSLSHRYYTLKAKWFGQDQLDFWDRNAPLPGDDNTVLPWSDAQAIVDNAYRAFSPQLADIGQQFFAKDWIDAAARAGKSSGAFSHPTVPSAHPYILMNYQGKIRDVMTLAHELGHGVHQVLAAPQGALMADTPLTLAETASVFGEMLTFQGLLSNQRDPARRRILIAGKVEDMLNTVVRQIAFHQFEAVLHDRRRQGELTVEEIGDIWMQVQADSLGPAIKLSDDYRSYWGYIPHFLHTPFYVYAYAFGDCLVNSLYAVYQEQPDGFAEKYIELLKAGGTLRHRDLLAPFGLDASDPDFWAKGLSVIENLIDQLDTES